MYMTDEQKYNAVLKELGELLQSKNTTIACQKCAIDELKAKLKAAEEERDMAKEDCETTLAQLTAALDEIAEMRKEHETC